MMMVDDENDAEDVMSAAEPEASDADPKPEATAP
jgi:hypothetical protein